MTTATKLKRFAGKPRFSAEELESWGRSLKTINWEKTTLGQRIRATRLKHSLRQEEVAAMANVTQAHLSSLELDKKSSTVNIIEFAYALRINPIWLDSGKGSPDLKVLNLNDAEIKVLDLYRGLSKEKQEDAINTLDRLNPFVEVDTDMGTRVRLIRKQLGLGQVEVAAKAGIFQTMLSNLERGKKYRTRRVIQLAAALDVPPEWLSLGIGGATAKKSRISKPELEFMLTFRTQAPAKQKKVIRWMTSSAGK